VTAEEHPGRRGVLTIGSGDEAAGGGHVSDVRGGEGEQRAHALVAERRR